MSNFARCATLSELPARSPATLRFTLILAAWLVFQSISLHQPAAQAPGKLADLLSIHVTSPPRWEKGCLSLSLERTNNAAFPLYIPVQGLDISTSAMQVPNLAGDDGQEVWVPVQGISDILELKAEPLAPGATIHDETCLSPAVGVVSRERATYRFLPLRGKLLIDAMYYLSAEDWIKNETALVERLRTSVNHRANVEGHPPETMSTLVAIPCHEMGCSSACQAPPPVVRGENRPIPDIYHGDSGWIENGRTLGLELATLSPACPENGEAP